MPFDDVCQGCVSVPIAASERARADEELQAARAVCVTGVTDCVQALQPACDDGQCVAVPLRQDSTASGK